MEVQIRLIDKLEIEIAETILDDHKKLVSIFHNRLPEGDFDLMVFVSDLALRQLWKCDKTFNYV